MSRNKAGIICMAAGVVLIGLALVLLVYNRTEDRQAGQAAEAVLEDLQKAIDVEDHSQEQYVNSFDDAAVAEAQKMLALEIDGYGYIGYLKIPTLGLELPVMDEWDYPRLQIAPCRQFGTVKGDDLVIAGHNYDTHFGRLANLVLGDEVEFTDMEGEVSSYQVDTVSVIDPDSTEEVRNSEWDLVLYTCTYGGQSRVMVGCMRTGC